MFVIVFCEPMSLHLLRLIIQIIHIKRHEAELGLDFLKSKKKYGEIV